MPLTPAQYKTAFALYSHDIADYNRKAADLADKLGNYSPKVAIPEKVEAIIHYDDLYLKALAECKYLQEHRMIPAAKAEKQYNHSYKVPETDLELGTAKNNLSKNVSVWKKRMGNPRYPDAEQKHAMYLALYEEVKEKIRAKRVELENLKTKQLC